MEMPKIEISQMRVSVFEDTFEPAIEFTVKIPLQQPSADEDSKVSYEEVGKSLITALLKRANLQIDDLDIPEIR